MNAYIRVFQGDCLAKSRSLPDNSVDSVVTDPPYGLDFMGKHWDTGAVAFSTAFWTEVLRVLKPGGHAVVFGGTRTCHRMACAIEDAGFEIRDQLAWVYGQGFPKSLDVSKAIYKAAGAEREVVGSGPLGVNSVLPLTAPATDAARQWSGWGTALKPAWEPICLARKPLSEPTVAANVLRWGTGAINVDACRIEGGKIASAGGTRRSGGIMGASEPLGGWAPTHSGRWPANLCHDGSQEVLDLFPESDHARGNIGASKGGGGMYGHGLTTNNFGAGDSGSAARFFYCAKASKHDRNGSKHPTVKPVKLMQWLVRMVTPPGGVVLDPFAGSGTTGEAAQHENFDAILIEREVEYLADITQRLGLNV